MKRLHQLYKQTIHHWFGFALMAGIAIIILIPPFQSPDEPNHFQRIHHIANGHFFGEINAAKNDLGGAIPKWVNTVYAPFMGITFDKTKKLDSDSISSNLFKRPSNELNEHQFTSFPNTARYAPTAYLPQVITISICNSLSIPPLFSFYLARLSAFLAWLCLIKLAISIAPVFKNQLLLLALLPTSLSVSASLSADTLSNAIAFLIIALFLKFKVEEKIEIRYLIVYQLLCLVLTWHKIVYFPLFFLLLFVSKNNFNQQFGKYTNLLIGCLLNGILIYWWMGKIDALVYPTNDINLTTYANLRPDAIVNPKLQTARILDNPILFLQNFLTATLNTYDYSFTSYLASFGWEGSKIPTGLMAIFAGFVLFYMFFAQKIFTLMDKIGLVVLTHGMVCLFILSQHLHWDAVGDTLIDYYGGKYYIPIYPLFLFVLTGVLTKYRAFVFDKLKLNYLGLLLFLIVHIDFLILIFHRYYKH